MDLNIFNTAPFKNYRRFIKNFKPSNFVITIIPVKGVTPTRKFFKNLFFFNDNFSIKQYTCYEDLLKPGVIAYTANISGQFLWFFSYSASEKIMFEIFKNKKSIPKSIGEIVQFQYIIKHIVPIPNAVKLHETFIASQSQHTAIKQLHPDQQACYKVTDNTADLDFGKLYTFIDVGSRTKYFFATTNSTQFFGSFYDNSFNDGGWRFWKALQNPWATNTAAIYFLQTISAHLEWLEFNPCTKTFTDLLIDLRRVVPIKHWKTLGVPLYGEEKTGLTLQASEERLRDLIPPLPASKTQKSNIALPLLSPAVPFTDTKKVNDGLLPAECVIKTQQPEISKPFDDSILKFFPYNKINMPEKHKTSLRLISLFVN